MKFAIQDLSLNVLSYLDLFYMRVAYYLTTTREISSVTMNYWVENLNL